MAKHPGGRPPKFNDAEAIAKKVLAYFDSCEKSRTMPNKAGLCISLNISRDTYNEYKKKFPDAIKAAESWIENAWVQRLAGNSPTGAIFYLKNAFKDDYREKQEVDHTSKGKELRMPTVIKVVQLKPKHEDAG
jgi:hypothetical protein